MHPYAVETEESEASRRERLITDHLPQVRLIARRFHEKLPGSVCLNDLISAGVIGLISAVDNYDPRQNTKLNTYAEFRIRGAILDSLRGMDWASRDRRRKARDIETAIQRAQQKLHQAPTEEEIAAEMGVSLDEYHARLVKTQGLTVESLEMTTSSQSGTTFMSLLADPEENLPSNVLERAELERLLARCIEEMPPKEKTVISLYYLEELTLREIGEVMDLHLSRIAELKTNAILRLRSLMRSQWTATR